MKDQNLPEKLKELFYGSYKDRYYKGWWEIAYDKDSLQKTDIYDNVLIIILNGSRWTNFTYYNIFKTSKNKLEISIMGVKGDGMMIFPSKFLKGSQKLNKVAKWLKEQIKEEEQ